MWVKHPNEHHQERQLEDQLTKSIETNRQEETRLKKKSALGAGGRTTKTQKEQLWEHEEEPLRRTMTQMVKTI